MGDNRLSPQTAAFYEQLWESAQAGCLGLLARLGCSQAEAEEIFADTYARVMERLDPIECDLHEAQMVAVTKTACRRELIDRRRRREGVLREVPVPEAGLTEPDLDAEDPHELAERSEAIAIGEEAVLSLRPRERLVFWLRHHEDRSPAEVRELVPHLCEPGYRRAIQRANAEVLAAFSRIESGRRCGEFDQPTLSSYICGTAEPDAAASIEAHLRHCRACQRECTEMRSYLHDVAGTLAVLVAAGSLGAASASGTLARSLAALKEGPVLSRPKGSGRPRQDWHLLPASEIASPRWGRGEHRAGDGRFRVEGGGRVRGGCGCLRRRGGRPWCKWPQHWRSPAGKARERTGPGT